MRAFQITAVVISIAIFAAAVLFSHFATDAAQSDETSQDGSLEPAKPVIEIQLSEHARQLKNDAKKTEDKPANDLSLLQKYNNVGTMGKSLSKEELDTIQKNGNSKPPEEERPTKNFFGQPE